MTSYNSETYFSDKTKILFSLFRRLKLLGQNAFLVNFLKMFELYGKAIQRFFGHLRLDK